MNADCNVREMSLVTGPQSTSVDDKMPYLSKKDDVGSTLRQSTYPYLISRRNNSNHERYGMN
jgi:hypothetical protein